MLKCMATYFKCLWLYIFFQPAVRGPAGRSSKHMIYSHLRKKVKLWQKDESKSTLMIDTDLYCIFSVTLLLQLINLTYIFTTARFCQYCCSIVFWCGHFSHFPWSCNVKPRPTDEKKEWGTCVENCLQCYRCEFLCPNHAVINCLKMWDLS